MKILTKEEEQAHDKTTWEGGILGALGGVAMGAAGIYGASRRFPAFRQLGLPFRGFILTSSTAFGGVIMADRYSRAFEKSRHANADYHDRSENQLAKLAQEQDPWTRAKTWISEQRYPIVFGSWVASMGIALAIVSRNPYASAQQKLVQARVYAQGLTIAVLVASFALESNDLRSGKGRWETIKVLDPNDPDHKKIIEKKIHHEAYAGEDQWMDMIESQERKIKQREENQRGKGKKSESGSKSENGDKSKADSKSGKDSGSNNGKKQQSES